MVVTRLQIMGGGNMGEALLRGLVTDGWTTADQLHVVEPLVDRRDYLAEAVPGLRCSDGPEAGVDTVLAVKPDVVADACSGLSRLGVPRVLSIAAGVRIGTLEAGLGEGVRVVRGRRPRLGRRNPLGRGDGRGGRGTSP